ncbi:CHAT domain-containing protein [Laspinema sp. D1]|uniref:CHAT domain-containing protein n=1 Tax=Laspinema palackyanum TaxID=3231601 RepID=UPI0034975FF1|nr:CHAT domain-containing protein [Laspinema sp. D2b]
MNKKRIQAYRNLIQLLLACPKGEEPQILSQSIELVDEGFVQTCQQVAQQLQRAGKQNQARFLRNLAQQVAAFPNQKPSSRRGKSRQARGYATEKDYIKFLMQVLQATEHSQSNPSVVYPLLQQNLDKLDLKLAQKLQNWASKTLNQVEKNKAARTAAVIGNFATLIQQFPWGNRVNNLEISIVGYEMSLTVLTRDAFPENWAAIQNNLGNAYRERIQGERGQNLELAIAFFQVALEVRTQYAFPEDWAMTQNNLGAAYGERIQGERGQNLELAIACYQAALEVRTRAAFPGDWALTQNNLGIAYHERIQGERGQNLELAIACYQAALEVRTRYAFPEDWGITQKNLGAAYRERIQGEQGQNLELAIACYQAALEVFPPNAFPENWAATQNNLGIAYRKRIQGERGQNLELAIAFYQEALQVYTPNAFPEKWAMTQNNLGAAYIERIQGERGQNLELAITFFQEALQVYTRDAFPQKWAMTQNNLGNAYCESILGERGQNQELAIASFQDALQVYTRDAFPEKWAMTQNNLGNAYCESILGERGQNQELAIASFQDALQVYTRDAFPEKWAGIQNNLGTAYGDRIQEERWQNLELAIASFQAALQVFTRESFPQDHAGTLFNLGVAYRDSSQLHNAYHTFVAAIDTVEEIRSGIIIGGEADKQKLAEKWQQLYLSIVEVCLELENYSAALEYAERSKARNLVELMAATRLKPPGVSLDVWEHYDALSQELWNLQQQWDSPSSPSPGEGSGNGETRSLGVASPTQARATEELSRSLTELRHEIDTLVEVEITPHDPQFRFGQQVQPIPYREIQALVDDKTAIVEWYVTRKGIHAFIVTRQREPMLVSTNPDALDGLDGLTIEYLTAYYNTDKSQWRQQLPSYLQRLAEILELDQLLFRIPSQCQELVLVPYRTLHLFPLHALPVGSPPAALTKGGEEITYLSDKFPQGIRYAPSSQILQLSLSQDSTLLGKGGEEKSLFAIQNPRADLDSADIEVEAIQTQFNPVTVLKGDAASKTGFNQVGTQLKDAAFVHFACHGSFDFDNPPNSGLILADAKLPETTARENGTPRIRSQGGEFDAIECLTLPEIFNLRFRQCRLVTLSACETGITDIRTSSDEYISILAGFFFAGSRNVLGTLWAVNDLSTAIFMIRFYETLLGENQPPVALAVKQTQEWMRQVTVAKLLEWIAGCPLIAEERKKTMINKFAWGYKPDYLPYHDPYFWAAFCAVGQ